MLINIRYPKTSFYLRIFSAENGKLGLWLRNIKPGSFVYKMPFRANQQRKWTQCKVIKGRTLEALRDHHPSSQAQWYPFHCSFVVRVIMPENILMSSTEGTLSHLTNFSWPYRLYTISGYGHGLCSSKQHESWTYCQYHGTRHGTLYSQHMAKFYWKS